MGNMDNVKLNKLSFNKNKSPSVLEKKLLFLFYFHLIVFLLDFLKKLCHSQLYIPLSIFCCFFFDCWITFFFSSAKLSGLAALTFLPFFGFGADAIAVSDFDFAMVLKNRSKVGGSGHFKSNNSQFLCEYFNFLLTSTRKAYILPSHGE